MSEQLTWDQVPDKWPSCEKCDQPAMEMVRDTIERLCSESFCKDIRPLEVHCFCTAHARESIPYTTFM